MTSRIKYNRKMIESGEAIYIGRGFRYHNVKKSKWHNPFTLKQYDRQTAIDLFKDYLLNGSGKNLLSDLHELKGKKIACHCELNEKCHGDILIQIINGQMTVK